MLHSCYVHLFTAFYIPYITCYSKYYSKYPLYTSLPYTSFTILKIGTNLNADHFTKGQFVDATSISKGKGFAGSMKRHNFSGGRASHGASVSHRAHGSTGNSQDPGRVFKGKKMAGHMGAKKVTKQNLEIIDIDEKNKILIIKGSIPGKRNSIVLIKDSIKKKN